MEESAAAMWWNENRADLKGLKSWDLFAQKQGSSTFAKFAESLQNARNALAGAGVGYTISNSILKNHLLFHSHPILRLRVTGMNELPFATMKVDNLIATMSLTWDSLLAEGVIKLPASLPTPASASPAFAPLTQAEKEALRAANGCYHCRKTPQTPGWIKHRSDNCPSDAALGIPPHLAPAVVAAVAPAGFSSLYEDGYGTVAAVMPAYDPDEDSYEYSSGTDDLSRED
ncbi:Reverse transcriptase domain-containing protein [Mycena venus]|uniref:Reverse transcriptase domain-containing protein n=1 Tax=Mycena venus TaxID=2733690 RepID=A0A8H6U4A0_9AGAR|nr:Reverse transcriptase domain-containing protein [Mycena venus]